MIVVDAKWGLVGQGGIARLIRYVVPALVERFGSDSVRVVGPAGTHPARVGAADEIFMPIAWPGGRPRWAHLWYDQVGIPRALRRVDATVFLSMHVEHPMVLPCALAGFIHDLASLDPRGRSWFNGQYYGRLLRRTARQAALVGTISTQSRRELLGRWPHLAERLVVVEPVVCALDARGPGSGGASARGRYLLYSGGAHGRKGIDQLIRTYGAARAAGLTCDLWLTGDRSAYAAVFPHLDREIPGVRFIGRLSDADLAATYREARAVVYLSGDEGYGLPIAEGLLAGVPVICSDLTVLREEHGDGPCYVANDDASIQQALQRVGDDEHRAALLPAVERAATRIRQTREIPRGWGELLDRLATIGRLPS